MQAHDITIAVLKNVCKLDTKRRDISISGAELATCWKIHRRASHVILVHRSSFGTSHRGCAASQHVAGPL